MIITNDTEANQKFDEASNLITKHITLHNENSGWKENCNPEEELNSGIKGLQLVLEYKPDHWPAYYLIGKAFQALKENEKSYEAFKAAYDLNKEQPDLTREYSIECMQTGRGEEALNIARKAIENNPSDSGLYANLALAEILTGKVDESLVTINKSIEINPNDNISLYLLKVIKEIKEGKRSLPKTESDLLS